MSYRRTRKQSNYLALAASGAYLAAGYFYYSHVVDAAAKLEADVKRAATEATRAAADAAAKRAAADAAAKRAEAEAAAGKIAEAEVVKRAEVAMSEASVRFGWAKNVTEVIECISRNIPGLKALYDTTFVQRAGTGARHFRTKIAEIAAVVGSENIAYIRAMCHNTPPVQTAYSKAVDVTERAKSLLFLDINLSHVDAMRHKHFQKLLPIMDVLQLLTILSSKEPLFSSINAAPFSSICLSYAHCHATHRTSLTDALCIMTKLAAMAISLLSSTHSPIWGDWDGVAGSFEFLIVPFCFFATMYEYFSASQPNRSVFGAFRSIISIHLLLLGVAALLRCADGGIGIFTGAESSALYMAIHGDVSLSRKAFPMEKIGLKQSYGFPSVEPFMKCVSVPAQECAGITTRLLNSGLEHDVAFKRIIYNVLDLAPISMRRYAMKNIDFRDEYGAINIDMDFFMHIVKAMRQNFIIEEKLNDHEQLHWSMARRLTPDAAWLCNTIDGVKFTAILIAMQLIPAIVGRGPKKK